jgi:gliding motility-associated-like protein
MNSLLLRALFSLILCCGTGSAALWSQCPIPGGATINGNTLPITVCPNQSFRLLVNDVTSSNLPNGGRIDWYVGTTSTFDPYTTGTFIGSSNITVTNTVPTRTCGTLQAGDIAFLSFRSDDPDAFSFVPLVNLAPGTQISFTDRGWRANNTFRASAEGILVWSTPPAGLAAGTIVTISAATQAGGAGSDNLTYTDNVGGSSFELANATDFQLATTGDQIFAYCGSMDANGVLTGTLLAGIYFNGAAWGTDATDAQTSALPPTLTNGINAVAVGNQDNGRFNCSGGTISGTRAAIAQTINTSGNWTVSGSPLTPQANPCTYNITTGLVTTIAPKDTFLGTAFCGQTVFIRGAVQPLAGGCSASNATTSALQVTVACPTPNIAGNSNFCQGRSDTLIASGGSSYVWNTGQTTDTLIFTPSTNTTFSVTTTDANGCTASSSRSITVNPSPSLSLSGDTLLCAGQTGSLSVSGATTYTWNTGATTASINTNLSNTTAFSVTGSNNGCESTASITVTVSGGPTVSINGVSLICNSDNSGAVNTTVTSSSGIFTYRWSNGETTAVLTGISAGTYTLTVTDTLASGSNVFCQTVRSATVTEPPVLSIGLDSIRNLRCHNDNSGGIFITPNGGTPGYAYQWSNGGFNQDLINLAAGNYSLILTDNNGCTTTAAYTVTQPNALNASISSVTPSGCNGINQGAVATNISGGTAPYVYLWSNGASSQNLSGLGTGTYTLSLSDANGCQAQVSTTVGSGGVTATLSTIQGRVCFGGNTGRLTANANPSTGTSYLWSNGASTPDLTGLSAGVYTVTVTNIDNNITCTDVLTATIQQPSEDLTGNIQLVQDLDCSGQAAAAVEGQAFGGWGNYQYNWSNGSSSRLATGLAAGNYILSITDAEGCLHTDSISITAPTLPQLNAWIGASGQSSTTVTQGTVVNLNAGTTQTGLSFQWTPSAALTAPTAAATSLTASIEGRYEFVVVASAGACTASDTVVLVVEATFKGFPTAFSPNSDGRNERFRPIDLDAQYLRSFKVFNRWGQLVYDNAQLSDGGWDGTLKGSEQPSDVYLYVVEYQLPQDAEPTVLRGEITLVR